MDADRQAYLRRARLPLAAALCLTLGLWQAPAQAEIDCRCMNDGEVYVQGEHTCLKTNDGYKLARCDLALNVTTWTIVGDSCPLTEAPAPSTHDALAWLQAALEQEPLICRG
ncbi:MAG: hypothetical protein Kilf2KO_34130 [Rhodospirillales bacterium]